MSTAISWDRTTVAVGTPGLDTVRIYSFNGVSLSFVTSVTRSSGSVFGSSVALNRDGNTLAVGFPDGTNGGVQIYVRSGGVWSTQGSALTITSANLGVAVALSHDGNTLAATGPFDTSSAGALFVYTRSGTTWTQDGSKLTASTPLTNKQFGGDGAYALDMSSDGLTIAVGSLRQTTAFIFHKSGGVWSSQQEITGGTGYGRSVSLSYGTGDVLAVGSRNGVGQVDIYTRSSGTWSLSYSITSFTGAVGASAFYSVVSLDSTGTQLAVGGFADNSGVGAVISFVRLPTGGWKQQGSKLVGTGYNTALNGDSLQGYSTTMSPDGNIILSGAPDDGSFGEGAMWIFTNGLSPSPTSSPTNSPSKSPSTTKPTGSPSTSKPTKSPSRSPSNSPTTSKPTKSPSKSPTRSPSKSPTTSKPTKSPSRSPSKSPSKSPTAGTAYYARTSVSAPTQYIQGSTNVGYISFKLGTWDQSSGTIGSTTGTILTPTNAPAFLVPSTGNYCLQLQLIMSNIGSISVWFTRAPTTAPVGDGAIDLTPNSDPGAMSIYTDSGSGAYLIHRSICLVLTTSQVVGFSVAGTSGTQPALNGASFFSFTKIASGINVYSAFQFDGTGLYSYSGSGSTSVQHMTLSPTIYGNDQSPYYVSGTIAQGYMVTDTTASLMSISCWATVTAGSGGLGITIGSLGTTEYSYSSTGASRMVGRQVAATTIATTYTTYVAASSTIACTLYGGITAISTRSGLSVTAIPLNGPHIALQASGVNQLSGSNHYAIYWDYSTAQSGSYGFTSSNFDIGGNLGQFSVPMDGLYMITCSFYNDPSTGATGVVYLVLNSYAYGDDSLGYNGSPRQLAAQDGQTQKGPKTIDSTVMLTTTDKVYCAIGIAGASPGMTAAYSSLSVVKIPSIG